MAMKLPKSFEQLGADFERREMLWKKKLPRKALERIPKRTHRHDDVGNAYFYLSNLAFRAGRFAQARHYFELREQLDRRHRGDADLEDHERAEYDESLDEAGWVSGDWKRYERYVESSSEAFASALDGSSRALVEGHINHYLTWAILGKRFCAERISSHLEPAASRVREALVEFAKPPALALAQSLAVDDELARAYFWLGDDEPCRAASDRFLASAEAWREIKPKPRYLQLGRLAPQRQRVTAIRWMAGETEEERRSPAASRHLVNYLVAMRSEPASYLFEEALLLVMAVARADREHPHVSSFLEAFPHLEHLTAL